MKKPYFDHKTRRLIRNFPKEHFTETLMLNFYWKKIIKEICRPINQLIITVFNNTKSKKNER